MITYGESLEHSEWLPKAEMLIEALPYLHRFAGARVVVKIGGELAGEPESLRNFAQDVSLLRAVGINIIVCHGGGPQISEAMKQRGHEALFIDGMRVTDEVTLEVTQMVLLGKIRQQIVAEIGRCGGRAIGLSGVDAAMITVKPINEKLGFVGAIEHISTDPIDRLLAGGYVPVISSLGTDGQGNCFNINADAVAGEIAAALGAEKLVLLTNVSGIFEDFSRRETLISEIDGTTLRTLREKGTFTGGMIPKVDAVLHALSMKSMDVHVLDGRQPHALLIEIFTRKGIGTMVFP
jgi:acetylglutamate kinase